MLSASSSSVKKSNDRQSDSHILPSRRVSLARKPKSVVSSVSSSGIESKSNDCQSDLRFVPPHTMVSSVSLSGMVRNDRQPDSHSLPPRTVVSSASLSIMESNDRQSDLVMTRRCRVLPAHKPVRIVSFHLHCDICHLLYQNLLLVTGNEN